MTKQTKCGEFIKCNGADGCQDCEYEEEEMTEKTDRERLVEIINKFFRYRECPSNDVYSNDLADAILQAGFVQKSTLLNKLGEMRKSWKEGMNDYNQAIYDIEKDIRKGDV